ncbi:hypothetical protein LUZ60_003568 [Juncus effusus]|nr:hypothetical protein LUZ60_003568 [Juncus effusus]
MAPTPTTTPTPITIDFSLLPNDLLLKILSLLPSSSDPRILPRLSCVSRRLRRLASSSLSLPLSLPPSPSLPPSTLHKLTVCCPGLSHSGVLFHQNSSDFGLSFEIGPDLSISRPSASVPANPLPDSTAAVSSSVVSEYSTSWSLFDDLYLDSSYDLSEAGDDTPLPVSNPTGTSSTVAGTESSTNGDEVITMSSLDQLKTLIEPPPSSSSSSSSKRRKKQTNSAKNSKWVGPTNAHLASGNWSLSREQGSKLLASRFRGDSLYICDWPGCVHVEKKRKYMLFRGVFKDFKKSRVWRTIVDSKRVRIKLDCAYCKCDEMWDLHSAFCLRGFIGFHEDGEPVVRAYVCDNGHVAGAWTERPMYG